MLAYAIVVLCCSVSMLKNIYRLSGKKQFYVLFSFCAFLFNAIMLAVIADGTSVPRYAYLGMFWLFPMPCIYQWSWLKNARFKKLVAICLVVVVIGVTNLQLLVIHYPHNNFLVEQYGKSYRSRHDYYDTRVGYLAFLQANNYTYGAAEFWDAPITTVLTNGDIRLLHVNIGSNMMSASEWLMPKEYTNLQEYPPEFLLLKQSDYQIRITSDFPVPGECVYSDEHYIIFDLTGVNLMDFFVS